MSTQRWGDTPNDSQASASPPSTASLPKPATQFLASADDDIAPASAMVLPGTRADTFGQLAHFRIDRRLAAGGMGEVYLGFDTSLQRPVAIKTIRPELAADDGFLQRFLREAAAQANVIHRNVVQVSYVGQDRGVWFIAMQVADGGDLHQCIRATKAVRWQDAATWMTCLVEGLCVAEERGIVHRDIKPANILFDSRRQPMLADFGLAVAAGARELPSQTTPMKATAPVDGGPTPSSVQGSELQLASVTQIGVIMGTPEYVAPEQLQIGAVDARADIYALAASFFHVLTGIPVIDARTLPEASARYARGHRAPRLRSLRPDVPRAFADVVDACLEPDREKRPATMAALVMALRRTLPQPEVPAGPFARLLVWGLDTVPFFLVTAATYVRAPWMGPVLFVVAGALGIRLLGSTPGIWLMRLRLRTLADGDVSIGRGFARFVLQHGWYLPATIGFSALYASSDLAIALVVAAVWFAVVAVGSIGALFGRRLTLHDRLSRTQVLVDVRSR